MSDEPLEGTADWVSMVDPIIRRCEVANVLNLTVAFSGESATALGALLKTMAEMLDNKTKSNLTFH